MNEIEIVTAFVVRSKRDRYAGFLHSPKSRHKFIQALHHFNDFDPAVVVKLSAGATREDLLKELRHRDGGPSCYIISTDHDLDATTLPLPDALDRIFTLVEGTIIACVPGRLAYYEGEAPNNRFILHRSPRP